MKRLALILLVGFLTAGTGGILDLVLPERCSATESASAPFDGACPATCLRCHCTRAFDIAFGIDLADAPSLTPEWLPPATSVPLPAPEDILHVPRPALG